MTKPLTQSDLIPLHVRIEMLEKGQQVQSSQYLDLRDKVVIFSTELQGIRAQAQAHSEKIDKALLGLNNEMGMLLNAINRIAEAIGIDKDDANSVYFLKEDLRSLRKMKDGRAAIVDKVKDYLTKAILTGLLALILAGVYATVEDNLNRKYGSEGE